MFALIAILSSLTAHAANDQYRNVKDLRVAIGSGNSWKMIPVKIDAEEARGKTQGCHGLLGDGWHVPTDEDLKRDWSDLQGTKFSEAMGDKTFWLANQETAGEGDSKVATYFTYSSLKTQSVSKIDANAAGKKTLVCVCGPNTTFNDSRRSKTRCLGFREDNATEKDPLEVEFVATRANGKSGPLSANYENALNYCKERGKRVPTTEELARIHSRIQGFFDNKGCVWSSSATHDEKYPREIWKFSELEQGGVMNSVENRPCYTVCVL